MKKLRIILVSGVLSIKFAESAIQYERDVLPTLQTKCVACHSETTERPFFYNQWTKRYVEKKIRRALISFEIVPFFQGSDEAFAIPYAENIYRVIRDRKMPPKAYTLIHPSKNISTDEELLISEWAVQVGTEMRKVLP